MLLTEMESSGRRQFWVEKQSSIFAMLSWQWAIPIKMSDKQLKIREHDVGEFWTQEVELGVINAEVTLKANAMEFDEVTVG